MEINKEDYLKRALLNTQEKIRNFKSYAEKIDDDELQNFFREYSLPEGMQAQKLQKYIKSLH